MQRAELAPRDTGAFLLSYDRRPFLRIIDVDAAKVIPVKTNLDRLGYALDYVVARDGFLAFAPNVSTALLSEDCTTNALVIENVGWPAPAVAPDHLWICPYGHVEEAREVDRVGNVLRTVTGPSGWAVRGELTDAFVVDYQGGQAALWRPGYDPEQFVPTAALIKVIPPDRVLVASDDGIREYDSRGVLHRRVEFELVAWQVGRAGVSHDARFVTIDTLSLLDRWSPDLGQRLRYCDLDVGSAIPITGGYEGFCYPPVFSRSGRHVFLGVPYENTVLGFAVDDLSLQAIAPPKARIRAMPLLDLGRLPSAIAPTL